MPLAPMPLAAPPLAPQLRPALTALAHHHGFHRVRFATAGPTPGPERLERYLAEGRHAGMDWFADTRDQRLDPSLLLSDVRTVMVLGMDYGWPAPPDPGGLTGRVSCYAWGRDYHNMLEKRLRKLRGVVQARWPGLRAWIGVDRAPAWERAWAEASGLGYAGKNACIIAPGETSYFFLAVLYLNREVEPDPPITEHCGGCQRCLVACPTGALVGPGRLDARRCISYYTIEHDGPIPLDLRPRFGTWLFGCDACQTVCPHVTTRGVGAPDFTPRNAWLDLEWLLDLPDADLVTWTTGTPLRRAAPHRLKRNALVVLGNRRDPAARPVLERAWRSGDPVLGEHAAWALDRLGR